MPPENEPQSPLPMNPDFAGYPTLEAFREGYRQSGAEAQRLRGENEKKDALIAQVLTNGMAANPRTVPDRRGTPAERLTDFGVPVDAIQEMVRGELQNALAPLTRGIQARGAMVSEHPEYVQFENDVAQFINNDPGLSQSYPKMFEADPAGAMEYAFLKFGDSRRRAPGSPAGSDRSGMTDAAIPSSRAGDGRRSTLPDEDVRSAFQRYQQTGSNQDAAAYARTRLKQVISDEHLNS